MLLDHVSSWWKVIGIDRDFDNIILAKENLKDYSSEVYQAEHASFASLYDICEKNNFKKIDFILYDLGVSSAHYDDALRWFSLRFDGPLDMRFDRTKGKTAEDLVMNMSEEDLRKIFYIYADEKKAPFIARAITEARKNQKIDTTFKLLEIIKSSSFDKKSPLRVFQALRIAVNEEFSHIEDSLAAAIDLLEKNGLIAVITFHSIEDRIVKQFFSKYLEWEIDEITGQQIVPPVLKKFNKKPIIPTPEEVEQNPRSRSAKLRIYIKNI